MKKKNTPFRHFSNSDASFSGDSTTRQCALHRYSYPETCPLLSSTGMIRKFMACISLIYDVLSTTLPPGQYGECGALANESSLFLQCTNRIFFRGLVSTLSSVYLANLHELIISIHNIMSVDSSYLINKEAVKKSSVNF